MLDSVVLVSTGLPYRYTYPLPFGLPSHSGRHSALSSVSCPVQCALLSILYIVSVVYMCQSQYPNSSYPSFPLGIHIFVLYVTVYFCFANKIINAIFLDYTYIH